MAFPDSVRTRRVDRRTRPTRHLRRLAACLLILSPTVATAADPPNAPQPNVLFILVDDLGWSDLGCYGAEIHQTPNIDRLAQQSMRFTDAYAAAPICSPTRASILTGKHPARLHMTLWHGAAVDPSVNHEKNPKLIAPSSEPNLAFDEVTVAEVLQEACYFTAHVGKWHLGDPDHYPMAHGFDVNVGGTLSGCPATFFFPFRGAENLPLPGLQSGQPGDYLTDRLTDEALQILDAHGKRPFFLHLSYYAVHTPIEGKPALVDRYRDAPVTDAAHYNPAYAAMVHSVDENVGRVLEKLDSLGVADRTLVILFSDNGGAHYTHRGKPITSNHPLREGKGTLYEGGVRVPLLVRWPGATRPGSICRRPVISTDFYPTILDVAGLRGAGTDDGLSLVPLLKNPNAALRRDALHWHYPHYYYGMNTPVSSIRQGDLKLLEYFEDGRLELYNLAKDPGEAHNLAKSLPEKAAELRQRLHAWRNRVDAHVPTPNPDYHARKRG